MEQQQLWPGAYSFQNELKIFLEYMQEQISIVLKKIDEADKKAV